jgi:hypothetical protein
MSSGGSNYSTGATGGGNQVRIDSPASQGGYGIAPPVNNNAAPGGKGGFPSVQNPYQQQPQMYMPPQQPSFYQQAFTQPRMQAPQMQYGLGGLRQGFNNARPELRSRQLGLNNEVARPSPYQTQYPVGPTPPQTGGALQDAFGGYFQPGKGSVASPQFSEPDPNTRMSTQALIPATQNGVSGYYTDGSQRNFVPYSQSGRGQSPFNPYSQQQSQLLALQQQGQQPFVETDDDFNKRVAKREADYYAEMESIYGKERANELRKLEGPINFAAGSTRGANVGGIG